MVVPNSNPGFVPANRIDISAQIASERLWRGMEATKALPLFVGIGTRMALLADAVDMSCTISIGLPEGCSSRTQFTSVFGPEAVQKALARYRDLHQQAVERGYEMLGVVSE